MGYVDDLKGLAAKFQSDHRYSNFGAVLQQLEVRGFRGIQDVTLRFASPITALSGLNGTGKSTIAQLAACAYRKPTTAAVKRYYVKDFFPVSAADPEPFEGSAQAVYDYCVEKGAETRVTVTRAKKEWSGYKRQPERSCYYVGFTQFIPKVERRDFSIYGGALVQLGISRELEPATVRRISGILAIPYEGMDFTEVHHKDRSAELAVATRNGRRYSENHMGFGEGRVVYMVQAMETAPAQSLFVLEEPETSLHGEAQQRLAEYLVDVCGRRGHQVILTTHSAAILQKLSKDSVAYLRRSPGVGALEVTPGLAAYQVDSYLRGGDLGVTGRVICVEDAFAQVLLTEIIRWCSPDLLAGCNFVSTSGAGTMKPAIKLLNEAGVKAVGVLDGDQKSASPVIRNLPGDGPPEREVFGHHAVHEHFGKEFGLDVPSALAAVADEHGFCEELARRLHLPEDAVASEACRVFVRAFDPLTFCELTDFLKLSLVGGV